MDARTCPPVTWSPTETRTEVSCPPVGNPRLVAPRVETDPLDSPPVLTAARSTRAVFGGAALCDPPHAPRVRVATTASTGSAIRRTEQRVTIGTTRGDDLGYDSRNESHFTGDHSAHRPPEESRGGGVLAPRQGSFARPVPAAPPRRGTTRLRRGWGARRRAPRRGGRRGGRSRRPGPRSGRRGRPRARSAPSPGGRRPRGPGRSPPPPSRTPPGSRPRRRRRPGTRSGRCRAAARPIRR